MVHVVWLLLGGAIVFFLYESKKLHLYRIISLTPLLLHIFLIIFAQVSVIHCENGKLLLSQISLFALKMASPAQNYVQLLLCSYKELT